MSVRSNSAPSLVRPPNRSYNSWDSLRYSQRNVPTIETIADIPLDTYEAAPSTEAQVDAHSPHSPHSSPRRANRIASVVSIHVDESPPNTNILYRFGWRSYVQIWAAIATSTTLCIASYNLYSRTHTKTPPP